MTRLHLGAAYYPEHWPETRWPEEIRLMQEAGLTVVRMGEFAWSSMEPAAGQFRFDWLDRAINLLTEAGIQTVLGTPTAAPPAWLIEQYPEILTVNEAGRRVQFGARGHYCVNSPAMQDATRRIVGALAWRFRGNPQIIGWQIDNELPRVCYCDHCRALFQQFLAERYGTLDALNAAWSTAYWSQTYSAWEQIPIPWTGGSYHNPGLLLEFRRFVTASNRRFQKLQVDILRSSLPANVWITHNFMGWFGGMDHYEMSADLDLASWDWYIGTGHHDYLATGAIHDLTRGFKRRNFWVMETQPGSVNWARVNSTLNQGESRALAWHAVAHGADALLYWQWRSALGGQEQYHGSLVDAAGRPRPLYAEVQQIGREFARVAPVLADTRVETRVAMLNCYESRWSIEGQRHHADFDYVAHFNSYYRPLAARNVAVDVISADAALDGYKLVIAPSLLILDEGRVERLREFVRRGGYLVLGARSGMKDRTNALLPSRQPGPLVELTGAEVEEYYALTEPVAVKGNLLEGEMRLWAERLRIPSVSSGQALDDNRTQAVARYGASNGWLDDQIAVSVHLYGSGFTYYVGGCLDAAAQQTLFDHILNMAGIPTFDAPAGVEVLTRVDKLGSPVYLLINHTRSEQPVTLPWPMFEHLIQRHLQGQIKVVPYGVAVMTKT